MRRLAIVVALDLAASSAHAFPRNFDGAWNVDVRTEVGACEPEVAGTVTVEDGKLVASSATGVAVWGYIDDKGDVSARFTQGQDMLRAQGRLKGRTGSGAWSSSTKYCGGKWTAQRAD